MLNAASFFGRTILNFLADHYGRFNIACPTAFITTGLVFLMFRATTVGGTIAFAILYGFFSGGCECLKVSPSRPLVVRQAADCATVASLLTPLLALFARDLSEVGYVTSATEFEFLHLASPTAD